MTAKRSNEPIISPHIYLPPQNEKKVLDLDGIYVFLIKEV